jgi:thioredoxin reductase
VFIGTRPCNDWLSPNVLRDSKGFVLTGRDLVAAEAYPRVWKELREPLPLETSEPGIFAAGDLRAGNSLPLRTKSCTKARVSDAVRSAADLLKNSASASLVAELAIGTSQGDIAHANTG